MGQLNNMDLEELALWSRIYGTEMSAQGKVQSEISDSPLSGLASDVTSSRRLRDIETEQLKANLQQTKSNVAMANSNMLVNQQNIQTQQSTIAKQMEEIATQRTQQTVNSALAQKAIADANASGSYAALLDSQNKGVGYENAKKQADSRIYTETGEETNKGLGILNYIKSWLPWTR